MKENNVILNVQESEALKLKNQLCFPLYAVSNKIIREYKPMLDELDLTYTQYITMMVLWEKGDINEKILGECLFLKSGTLTPLLKKLESKGFITKVRDKDDERSIVISITENGKKLKQKAKGVPKMMAEIINIQPDEAEFLYKILYKILED